MISFQDTPKDQKDGWVSNISTIHKGIPWYSDTQTTGAFNIILMLLILVYWYVSTYIDSTPLSGIELSILPSQWLNG